MAKEQVYRQQLEQLGIYDPAFDSTIHDLCILERELSRTMKAWKATASPNTAAPRADDPLYAIITKQRQDILHYRDALGLTPKALQRLRKSTPTATEAATAAGAANKAFASVLDKLKEASHAGK